MKKQPTSHDEELLYLAHQSLEQSHDMIYWLNPDSTLKYFNNTFCERLGYTPEEMHQKPFISFFKNYSEEGFRRDWKKMQAGKSLHGEVTLITKDGAEVEADCRVSLVSFRKKEVACAILRDITDRKKQERQLSKQIAENERLRVELQEENIILKEEIRLEYHFNNIITQSKDYKKVLRKVEQVADSKATVLIHGETGTGKELLARAIHQLSNRSERPLIKVNCASLPENLIESELFGHEKGAFTGAFKQKKGRFERAHKGTLLLDEISEFPLELQPKLLHVLQEGEFERVGGTEVIRVDVRVIVATNRNLEDAVSKGAFREDLYYRLNVFPIFNPPLRHRREDIPLLVRHFVEKHTEGTGKRIEHIPESELNKFFRYEFPGNVRELENIVERAVILSNGKHLKLDDAFVLGTKRKVSQSNSFKSMDEVQQEHILAALQRTQWRVSGPQGAAKLLDMNPKTLFSRMKKLGINREVYTDI